jgi:streptogramin lyase
VSRTVLILLIALLGLTAPMTSDASPGDVTHFPLPAGSVPRGITTGPDGALWFTERGSNMIGRISASGQVREFPVPTAGSEPFEIATGPDGNLWFTENASRKIGRITPDGDVVEFPIPECGDCRPWGIVAGPDGNVWFTTAWMFGAVGRATPQGEITIFQVGGAAHGIVVGPDGNLWVAAVGYVREDPTYGLIARVTPGGFVTRFPIPPPNRERRPSDITAGPDGSLWFVGEEVGRIDTSGLIKVLNVPVPGFPFGGGLDGIITGPDGNLWFGSSSVGGIARVTPSGRTSHFQLRHDSQGVTVGPDGAIWFTEWARHSIGRLTPGLAGIEIGSSRASVRGRFTRLALACSGSGRGGRCKGVLRLVACIGSVSPEGRCQRISVLLARAGYDLLSGRSGSVRLRLTERALRLLERSRELIVKAVARPSVGVGMTRPLTLRRRVRR